ncbi:afadin- and alpha-actinin-binding protein B-like isoform X2 [Choloepus didactylus]|uniref:afadin- and alpha-actinin-binding protein B-like isoform X2 n=1 Tax=Choloepus didactylus TaxID=27675 RepID=UPI00189F04DF|nr:afadin- and alpha-actinin-binding protein B-like isoform X2 [Choloepus didactylus]
MESSAPLYKDPSLDRQQQKRFRDLDSLRGRQDALQAQVQICEQKIAAVLAQEQELEEQNEMLRCDLGKAWQEVKQFQEVLINQKVQYDYELKKKEKELGKLKEQMQQMQGEQWNRQGKIDILNNLKRSDGKHTMWKTGKANGKKEGELIQTVVRNLEDQVAAVSRENEELKQLLTRLGRDLAEFLGCPWDGPTEAKVAITVDCGALWKHWSCFKKEVEVLKKQGQPAEELQDRNPVISITDHDKELVHLRQEIQWSLDFITWQQHCFQEQLSSGQELPVHLQGSCFLEEEQRLQEAQILFAQERAHFEAERHRFTEAAIRLGHERWHFELERVLFWKKQLLGFSLHDSSQSKTPKSCFDAPEPQTLERELGTCCPVSCSFFGLSQSSSDCPCVPECYTSVGVSSLPCLQGKRVHWSCCGPKGNHSNLPPDLLDSPSLLSPLVLQSGEFCCVDYVLGLLFILILSLLGVVKGGIPCTPTSRMNEPNRVCDQSSRCLGGILPPPLPELNQSTAKPVLSLFIKQREEIQVKSRNLGPCSYPGNMVCQFECIVSPKRHYL